MGCSGGASLGRFKEGCYGLAPNNPNPCCVDQRASKEAPRQTEIATSFGLSPFLVQSWQARAGPAGHRQVVAFAASFVAA